MRALKYLLLIQICFASLGFAQGSGERKKRFELKVKHPIKQFYAATGGELIFAYANVSADSLQVENKLRFSFFPHLQQQYHYNFSKVFGFYTGFSLINVGMRNYFTTNNGTEFDLRQRAMSIGIPLALKIGNLRNGNHIAIGTSAECMFHYKQKLYFNKEKMKRKGWFADDVNLFNTSVYIDLRTRSGSYIRFKYYLNNFLVPQNQILKLSDNLNVNYYPAKSVLFFFSIGHTFMKVKPRKLTLDDV